MVVGMGGGIVHFPDYKPYDFKCPKIGDLPFARGINVLICSQIEQEMSDCEFEIYSRDFAVFVHGNNGPNVPFQELVFG